MAESRRPRTPSSASGDGGVRVSPKPGGARSGARWSLAVVAVMVAAGGVWWLLAASAAPETVATGTSAAVDQDPAAIEADKPPGTARGNASRRATQPRSNDPNDLAAHFRPGDPEPTGAEVIEALQHAGVRTGLGAFNPPGTSPPLEGLAVPDDFDLPQGYVRHHQVTDGGVPIEPILMFSPDFTLYDAQGRAIPMPANRVVPPELAPPGLPPRRVRVR